MLWARFAVDGHCHSVSPSSSCLWRARRPKGAERGDDDARVNPSVCLQRRKFKKPNRNLASIVGRSVGRSAPFLVAFPSIPAPVAESAPWSFRSCAACAARDKNRLRNEPRVRPLGGMDGEEGEKERERKKGGAKNETFVTAVSCKSKWARSLSQPARFLLALRLVPRRLVNFPDFFK